MQRTLPGLDLQIWKPWLSVYDASLLPKITVVIGQLSGCELTGDTAKEGTNPWKEAKGSRVMYAPTAHSV
jgi:hypothetical protein